VDLTEVRFQWGLDRIAPESARSCHGESSSASGDTSHRPELVYYRICRNAKSNSEILTKRASLPACRQAARGYEPLAWIGYRPPDRPRWSASGKSGQGREEGGGRSLTKRHSAFTRSEGRGEKSEGPRFALRAPPSALLDSYFLSS